MLITFTSKGWDDYQHFVAQDRKILKRINALLADITRGNDDGGAGIGKPERLHGNLAGLSSRRINGEHRLVYELTEGAVVVIACRYHYGRND